MTRLLAVFAVYLACITPATAGAWLRDVDTSFEAYGEQWQDRLNEKPDSLLDYPDSVFGATALSLEKVERDHRKPRRRTLRRNRSGELRGVGGCFLGRRRHAVRRSARCAGLLTQPQARSVVGARSGDLRTARGVGRPAHSARPLQDVCQRDRRELP